MKVVVLIKEVPDTAATIRPSAAGIDEKGIKWIVSPFDEHALEAALQLKDQKVATETVAVTLGPERKHEALRHALAVGIDRVHHLKHDESMLIDAATTAAMLAHFLNAESPDLVIAGDRSIDSASSIVPIMVAAHLGTQYALRASEFKFDSDKFILRSDDDTEGATITKAPPLLFTAAKSLNTPRYPNLKGTMAAKKATIPVSDGVVAEKIDRALELVELTPPPARAEAKLIDGDVATQVAELLRLLRDEARVV